MVAHFKALNPLTHTLDDRARFVPQDAREEALRILARQRVDVGVAERVGDDLTAHLPRLRWRHVNDFSYERLVGRVRHGSLALDHLASGLGERGQHGARSCSGLHHLGGLRVEGLGVVLDVVVDETGDKEVRMITAILHAHLNRLAHSLARSHQLLGLKLVLGEEIIRSALVHKDPTQQVLERADPLTRLHELVGVVRAPLLRRLEVAVEGLGTPRARRRVADRGERGDRAVARVLHGDSEGTMTAHRVARD
mmetsp:Transcript_29342/g.78744  ORF Transcript_29342/g.78744 Transcript_29342/m.78744 type:complete len:252 (-) Transcript_29342:482-1237(-)